MISHTVWFRLIISRLNIISILNNTKTRDTFVVLYTYAS